MPFWFEYSVDPYCHPIRAPDSDQRYHSFSRHIRQLHCRNPFVDFICSFYRSATVEPGEILLSLIALAVSANVKPQFMVLVTILLTILCIFQIWCLARQSSWRELGFFLGLAAISYLLVPATGIHNLLVYRNPVYPLAISIFGKNLPGIFQPEDAWKAPDYLAHVSQPLRWL